MNKNWIFIPSLLCENFPNCHLTNQGGFTIVKKMEENILP